MKCEEIVERLIIERKINLRENGYILRYDKVTRLEGGTHLWLLLIKLHGRLMEGFRRI